jgi:cell division protein FtsB
MWDQAKRNRFQDLRRRELEGALPPAEREELVGLVAELEAEEAAYLSPATERLRREREQLDAQNRALSELIRRKEALATRLQRVLLETQAERQAIEQEARRILGVSQPTVMATAG